MAKDEIYRALFEQSNDAIFITKGEHILEVNLKAVTFSDMVDLILKKCPFSLHLLKNLFLASRMH
ncbi:MULTISPECIES: PAS domain-containing protein [Methanosarcina]|uniref:PAS domain-containing protein n=1 Tax=Methanosarcina TaxID=2207 RepID=UPI00064F9FDF|nr:MULTISPECIES: PAS domain-containing protein [Methanosarcina]OEC91171.1 hypothetical protein A9239_03475 [Methanosarcina sp. A14]